MASITKYETKKGTKWRVQYRDPSGTLRNKRGFDKKSQAAEWAAKNTVDIAGGEWINPELKKITVKEIGTRWLAAQTHLKPSTARTTEGSWRVHSDLRHVLLLASHRRTLQRRCSSTVDHRSYDRRHAFDEA